MSFSHFPENDTSQRVKKPTTKTKPYLKLLSESRLLKELAFGMIPPAFKGKSAGYGKKTKSHVSLVYLA